MKGCKVLKTGFGVELSLSNLLTEIHKRLSTSWQLEAALKNKSFEERRRKQPWYYIRSRDVTSEYATSNAHHMLIWFLLTSEKGFILFFLTEWVVLPEVGHEGQPQIKQEAK